MAKECINCGKKFSFFLANHLDGLLCDECFIAFGGALVSDCERQSNPEKIKEYYNRIVEAVDKYANLNVDREKIKYEFYKEIESNYKKFTGNELEEQINKVVQERQREEKHVDFAKSFNEFYEYDVVTIINENHGTVDKAKMMQILSEHAKKGWKLHTMYSNELGKNALMILGFGVNATACEDVMIFERRIQNIEE